MWTGTNFEKVKKAANYLKIIIDIAEVNQEIDKKYWVSMFDRIADTGEVSRSDEVSILAMIQTFSPDDSGEDEEDITHLSINR